MRKNKKNKKKHKKNREISQNFLFLNLISLFVFSSLLITGKQLSKFENGQILEYNNYVLSYCK